MECNHARPVVDWLLVTWVIFVEAVIGYRAGLSNNSSNFDAPRRAFCSVTAPSAGQKRQIMNQQPGKGVMVDCYWAPCSRSASRRESRIGFGLRSGLLTCQLSVGAVQGEFGSQELDEV